ncbi:MAG: hypothetical protein JWQ76_3877, partial [Ramlibacter sp.]|nr:hypothetical protein [Ramlibacter sp.]
MASRSSPFHPALHRPKLIMGLEKGMFGALALAVAFAVVVKAVWFLPMALVLFLAGRWLSKVDDRYLAILMR